jgi:hypothetical protein
VSFTIDDKRELVNAAMTPTAPSTTVAVSEAASLGLRFDERQMRTGGETGSVGVALGVGVGVSVGVAVGVGVSIGVGVGVGVSVGLGVGVGDGVGGGGTPADNHVTTVSFAVGCPAIPSTGRFQ